MTTNLDITMEIENTNLNPSVRFMIETEIMVEEIAARADGREPFSTPVFIGHGELVRTTDGKVRYIAESL